MRTNKFGTWLAGAVLLATGLVGASAPAQAATNAAASSSAAAVAQAAPPTTPPDKAEPVTPPAKPTSKDTKPKGNTKVKKKAPPNSGGVSTFATCTSPCYFYSGVLRNPGGGATIDGISDNVRINKPNRAGDYHSLGEVIVQKGAGSSMNAVEIGWTVDPALNGDDDPHLFVYWWKLGAGQGYNGAGFVDNGAEPLDAGDSLAGDIGVSKRMFIWHYNGAWWVSYDNKYIGYFPDSLWGTGVFTNTTYQQVFGEIAATTDPTCSEMGNGIMPVAGGTTAALMGSLSKIVGQTASAVVSLDPWTSTTVTRPTSWGLVAASSYTFRYGGPGDC
ncbi:MAG TPA: neprosin family prolyl endopeptidase [Candidatus Saccharimonadales bacterium]|nr:neprosin family prolyl endopeptidase [Candidatus Saccharimonadales bacterium]